MMAAGRDLVGGYVFISYVREDSARVDRLQRALQDAGIPVWRDTSDLWPGEDWRARIRNAITDDALIFIVCFSGNSLARARSYQNEELVLAVEQLRLRRPEQPWLIPVRFDECEIPERDLGGGRLLSSLQRVDLFGGGFDDGAARLVTAIRRILGPSRAAGAGAGQRDSGGRLGAAAPEEDWRSAIDPGAGLWVSGPGQALRARQAEQPRQPDAGLQARAVHAQPGPNRPVPARHDAPVPGKRLPVGTPGTPIRVGYHPRAIAITPDGSTAYVALSNGEVIPVDLASRRAGTPIKVMNSPSGIAITPDGRTAYVTHASSVAGTVTPINCSTNTPGKALTFGKILKQPVITPNGATAYVLSGCHVVPIDLARGKRGRRILLDRICANSIAITPDGSTAYVIATVYQANHCHVVSVNLATSTTRTLTTLPYLPGGEAFSAGPIKISPDGVSAYMITREALIPIGLPGGVARAPIPIASPKPGGGGLRAITIAPDGSTAYVLNNANHTLVPVSLDKGSCGAPVPIKIGPGFNSLSELAIAPDGATVYILGSDGTITPVSMNAPPGS